MNKILDKDNYISKLVAMNRKLREENSTLKYSLSQHNQGVRIAAKTDIQEAIINTICDYFKVSIEDIASSVRKREIISIRFILCHFLYYNGYMSYTAIGRILNRDHSTIIHAVKSMEERLIEQLGYPDREDYLKIEKLLQHDTRK